MERFVAVHIRALNLSLDFPECDCTHLVKSTGPEPAPNIPHNFPNPHNRNFSRPAYLDDASFSQGRRRSGRDAQTTTKPRLEPRAGTVTGAPSVRALTGPHELFVGQRRSG